MSSSSPPMTADEKVKVSEQADYLNDGCHDDEEVGIVNKAAPLSRSSRVVTCK